MESDNKFRNLPITTFWKYEDEYVLRLNTYQDDIEVVGSWRVQLQSYNLSLNMWIPEVAQLKTGIAIVVKFRFPKSCFICLCDSWPHFDSWRNRCKNLVLFGKNKMR